VNVAYRRVEEDAADEGQSRVADPAVRPDHRALANAARKSIAHDQIASIAQLVEQRADGGEVVAVVGVAHDHKAALRGCDSTDQRASVTLPLDVDHADAELPRQRLRTVAAAVVGDDDLGLHTKLLDRRARFADAGGERLGLVEARHHDRELEHRGLRACGSRSRTLGDAHGRSA